MKKICETKPMLFEGYLILALSKEWLDAFGELPTFEASLDDNGKLHLVSTKSVYQKKHKSAK
jgi:hypothetical protein